MKRILLILLLAISISGVANAQWKVLGNVSTGLKRTPMKLPIVPRIQTFPRNSTSQAWQNSALRGMSLSSVGQSQTELAANVRMSPVRMADVASATVQTKLPFSPQKFVAHYPQKKVDDRFHNVGFVPQVHNTAPAENILDSDHLLQEVQRQEILSNKQDRLREKIYKSLNKLNSTEWESTITGHIIYNNEFEYEYILDAA